MKRATKITYSTSEVQDAVDLLIDEWGVPHIYASCPDDAFFAQGFNIARDRLWQIDLWRRKGLGLLSEVYGDRFLLRDRAARLLLYRGDMEREWSSYGGKAREIISAFVRGINYYIQLIDDGAVELPAEFRLMGYAPARWNPEDVPRIRTHGVFGNLREEVARAETVASYGERVENLRKVREPDRDVSVSDRAALEAVTKEVLHTFDLATKPVDFQTPDTLPVASSFYKDGSNNWAISSGRSETGRPVLSNDPHRVASVVPGLRYICHLSCPEFDVIGGGEPCIPGISIGHNGTIAFGMTTFSLDQEDLFVLELNPENGRQYRYDGMWEDFIYACELIPMKEGGSREVELCFSRFGPVLLLDETRGRGFALKAAWLDEGMAPYLKSIDSMMQTNVDNFVSALHDWGAPPLNMVYADKNGSTGWQVVGRAPVRSGWDGLVPVPGEGSYTWSGFRPGADLPGIRDPSAGYVATANEMNIPAELAELELGFDWFAPYRKERIDEVLGGAEPVPFATSAALQMDWKSAPAAHLITMLKDYIQDDAFWSTRGFKELGGWDFVLSPDSPAACIFEVWFRKYFRVTLRKRALSTFASREHVDAIVSEILPAEDLLADARMDIRILREAEEILGDGWSQKIREDAESSMREALSFLEGRFGVDEGDWNWGKLHTAKMSHPLAPISPELASRAVLGPVPRGGSGDTVGDTAYNSQYVQTGGSTFRVVIDVGEWDSSLAMNSPGQSGDLGSPHFSDLFDRWAAGDMFPLLYSRERIEEHADNHIQIRRSSDVG